MNNNEIAAGVSEDLLEPREPVDRAEMNVSEVTATETLHNIEPLPWEVEDALLTVVFIIGEQVLGAVAGQAAGGLATYLRWRAGRR